MKTKFNTVHSIIRKPPGQPGLEVKCNWRYWGLGISWGDSFDTKWFVGFQLGPLFLIYQWGIEPPPQLYEHLSREGGLRPIGPPFETEDDLRRSRGQIE